MTKNRRQSRFMNAFRKGYRSTKLIHIQYAKATCRMIALALMVQFTPLCTPYVLYKINSVSANICALTIALLLHKLSFLIFNRPKKEPQMNYCTKYLHHTKKIEFVGKDEHLYRICTTYVA